MNDGQPKSKEQILREMEVARKRTIVKDRFYPALVKATVSIDEAKMLTQAAVSFIMEEVLSAMKERKFEEIKDKLIEGLCKEDETRKQEITELFDTLNSEDFYVAREIIEGMNRAIDHTLAMENRDRTLSTLNPNWDIMLHA